MSNSKLFNKQGKDFGVSGPFGIRNIPSLGLYNNYHIGVDYPYTQGTELVFPVDVEIIKAYTGGDYGGQVYGYNDNLNKTIHLAHMTRIDVRVGEVVKAGTVVGLSGGLKGTHGAGLSTGAHLHMGVAQGRKTDVGKGRYGDGTWVNPDTFDFAETKPKEELISVGGAQTLYKGSSGSAYYGKKTQTLQKRNMKVLARANGRVQVSTAGILKDNGDPVFDVASFWIVDTNAKNPEVKPAPKPNPRPTPKAKQAVVGGSLTLYKASLGSSYYGKKTQTLKQRTLNILETKGKRIRVDVSKELNDNGKRSFDVNSFWVDKDKVTLK